MTRTSGTQTTSQTNLGRQRIGGREGSAEIADSVCLGAPSTDAPKLLVSVRSRSEISDALSAGVDIVDLKEPRRGALSPAEVDLWRYAASLWRQRWDQEPQPRIGVQDRPPSQPLLSAALGERSEAIPIAAQLPGEFAFAKVGPSGCDSLGHLGDLWSQLRQLLDVRVELVAVAYADFRPAHCVPPEQIFQEAIEAGFRRCLIDTYSKDGLSTIDHLGVDRLRRLSDLAREAGLWWAFAGSVNRQVAARLWTDGVHPTCFGVRGDVCHGGRTGTLSVARIEGWKESLASLVRTASNS